MSSRERKKAAALQEKLQILRSITHSHAVINHTLSFLIKFFSLLNFSCACMSSLIEKKRHDRASVLQSPSCQIRYLSLIYYLHLVVSL